MSLSSLITELRCALGERQCPPGMRWDPRRKKCAPSNNRHAVLGFRAGRRGGHHHGGHSWNSASRGRK